MLSIRERIEALLTEIDDFIAARDIAAYLGIDAKPREIYEHLKHIAKSVHRRSGGTRVLAMIPPRCRKCGYVFKDLDEPWQPSRCPRCRSMWIEPPRFKIIDVK